MARAFAVPLREERLISGCLATEFRSRPHEGLNNQVPASLYVPSAIRLPSKLPEFMYPKGLQLLRGSIATSTWDGADTPIGQHELVALSAIWRKDFGDKWRNGTP
jgi:hypothetical protein